MMRKIVILIMMGIASCAEPLEIDTLIFADKIYSCDSSFNINNTIAIHKGKIIMVGERDVLDRIFKPTNTIDVSDKYVYPGFIDAHCHFSGYALNKYMCDLIGTKSFNEVIERVIDYEKVNKLTWLYGRGWDQNDWEDKQFPDKEVLDKLFPDKPVILKRIDGHAILCNQKALDLAGINKQTNIAGGIIEKKNGLLTGILIDNACNPVEDIIPELSTTQKIHYLKEAEKECFSYGLTGVVDCGINSNRINFLDSLYKENLLIIGNSVLLSQDKKTLVQLAKRGFYKNGQFQINGIKMYADGALGSRGACLLHAYSDKKDHYGMMLSNIDSFRSICRLAKEAELQLCTHAIGDSANRAILRLYSEFLEKGNDARWRIEHAQVVDYQDYNVFSEYNIIPSVQPTHATSDMPWAIDRLGEKRISTAYAYKKLLQQNEWMPLGTDFPVEQINPLTTFYAAVTRKDKNGNPKEGFMADQALSRKEALLGMTMWAAKSVFWENEKGSLKENKYADLVILDTDIMNCTEDKILNTKVLYTIVKGKIVYNSNR